MKSAVLDTTAPAPDTTLATPVTPLTYSPEQAAWAAAFEAHRIACRHSTEAYRKRVGAWRTSAAGRLSPDHPLMIAEKAAEDAERMTMDAMMVTPALDPHAFLQKLDHGRAWLDDCLNLDVPADRKAFEEAAPDRWPGSAEVAAIKTDLRAAMQGAALSPIAPRLIALAAMTVCDDVIGETFDPSRPDHVERAVERFAAGHYDATGPVYLASLYIDALAIDGEPTDELLRPTADCRQTGVLGLWDAHSLRLLSKSAGTPDLEPTGAAEAARIDAMACSYVARIEAAPITTTGEAIFKVHWLKRAFEEGETGNEEKLLDQLAEFLGGHPDLTHPDAELLALSVELDRRWRIEEQQNEPGNTWTDEQADAATEHTGEIAHRIHNIVPRTVAGWRVRAQAIAWQASCSDEPMSPALASGHFHNDATSAAKLVDDLRALPRSAPAPHPDAELLAVVEAYRRAENIADHIGGNAMGGQPKGKAKEIYHAATAEVDRLRERSFALRATTLDGYRAKALMAQSWLITDGFEDFDSIPERLHRSLIADLTGCPTTPAEMDNFHWQQANGWTPPEGFVVEGLEGWAGE